MKKHVIIASHPKDQSAAFLARRLVENKQNVRIVNFGDFPTKASASVFLGDFTEIGITTSDGFLLNQESVKSIWWRRPQGPTKCARTSLLQKYIQNESEIVLASTLSLLTGVKWVSDPEATRVANRKPLQLSLAQKIGFNIPITCISNNPEDVTRFIVRYRKMPLIMKPAGSSFVRLSHDIKDRGRKNKVVYTRIVDTELLLKNIAQVSNCPFILQQAIVKDSDIRITVVGNQVFASEILIESNSCLDNVDWRHHGAKRRYVSHQLPKNLQDLCVELVAMLGLKFGCIDMGFSKKDGYVFFEINPQGQWMPSELILGYPISQALSDLLSF